MSPLDFDSYSDAPTMILPPAQDSPFNPIDMSQSSFQSATSSSDLFTEPSSFGDTSASTSNGLAHRSSWTPTTTTTPIFTNPSRKRSRDESALIDDADTPDTSYFPVTPAPPSIPEEELIYGEGMTLLNPSAGIVISAESQTGTWYEENAEAVTIAATKPLELLNHLDMQSRKSQRLDITAPGLDDIAALAAPDSPPKSAPIEPTVDESTIALGIGWTRICEADADVQAAARGWAKYIDNHYPEAVHGAKIMLKSKGLNAYLVGAEEGFFLFKEDLAEARLVGRTWDRTLANLMTGGGNVQFEGESITAREVSASSPEITVDEKIMDDGIEAVMANGNEDTGHEKPMTVDEVNVYSHEMSDETEIQSESAANVGQVDGGMDID